MTKLAVVFFVSVFQLSCVLDSHIVSLNSNLDDKNTDPTTPGSSNPDPSQQNPIPPVVSVPKVIKKISGSGLTCASHDQGMDCWDSNNFDQIGIPGASKLLVNPLTVIPTPIVSDFAVGPNVTCIVVDSGVLCSGTGTSGLLGNGSTANSATFVTAIASGSGVTAISVGSSAVCAIRLGGLYCWGAAGYVGDGSNTLRSSPIQIFAQGFGVTKVALGSTHSCAIVAGEVWCWGLNTNGQLGDGTLLARLAPVKIPSLGTGVSEIYSGSRHSCALKNGGLSCWGLNSTGNLGDNTTTTRNSPVSIYPPGSGVTQAALGIGNSCALVAGQLWCWGSNQYGEQNDCVSTSPKLVPNLVLDTIAQVTFVASGNNNVCVVEGNTKIVCWGAGTLGAGPSGGSMNWTSPQPVSGLTTNVSALAKADLLNDDSVYQNCAIQNGGVKCWGSNLNGGVGDGTSTNRTTPVTAIPALSSVTDLAEISGTTNASTCAVVNGGIKCWGSGYGLAPMQIVASGSGASSIQMTQYDSFFDSYACSVIAGGVQCWGTNTFGQLGNGSTTSSSTTPVVAIAAASGVTKVEVRQGSSCAVINGGLNCWGYNDTGQIGDGSTTQRNSPVQIFASGSGVTDVIIVGAWSFEGSATTCAVIAGGLKCWGFNSGGLVGDGSTTTRLSPVDIIPPGSGVTKVFGSSTNLCAIKNSGLFCWGSNTSGGLGVGDKVARTTPTLVIAEGSGVTSGYLAYNQGCAVVNAGLKCWGANTSGVSGDGTVVEKLTPVTIYPSGSSVTAVGLPYRTVTCAIINSAEKCWGTDSNFGLMGTGVFSRGMLSVSGFEN